MSRNKKCKMKANATPSPAFFCIRPFLYITHWTWSFCLATGILPEKEPVPFHFMHTVKAAEPELIRQPAQRAPAPNRLRLEGLACINSKKWDKGAR